MKQIPIKSVPNQTVELQIDDVYYKITLKTVNLCTAVTIEKDGETLIQGMRAVSNKPLIPYDYMATDGNFSFVQAGQDLPYYTEFGITQFLMYFTAAEIEEYKSAAGLFDPNGAVPLRYNSPMRA